MKVEKILTYSLVLLFFMAASFVVGQKTQQQWDKNNTPDINCIDDCKPLDEAYQDLILVIYHNQPSIIEDWLCETDEWEYLSSLNDDWVYLREEMEEWDNQKLEE